MSSHSSLTSLLVPSFTPSPNTSEPFPVQLLIKALNLQQHPEGGYFVETDRDPLLVPNPFHPQPPTDATRNASTTIFYLLTPSSPMGVFHRNKGRTVHTLHRGRGRYVILHPPETEGGTGGGKARIETFVVGQDTEKGERLQWIVQGGRWKASFLLPDGNNDDRNGGEKGQSQGLLISEVSSFSLNRRRRVEGAEK